MRVQKEDCFVLRTTPFSESSLIVDTFSRNYGRLNLLAKGARRMNSAFRGTIRPFQYLVANWSGKGKVPNLTNAAYKSLYVQFQGERLYGAFHLNELIIRLLHDYDPHPALFEEYRIAIDKLADSENLFHTVRVFEKRLLTDIGYALVLETEANRKTPIHRERFYEYDFEAGPIPISERSSGSVAGETLLAISREKFESTQVQLESRILLGRAVEQYLGSRALRCRGIYNQTVRGLLV